MPTSRTMFRLKSALALGGGIMLSLSIAYFLYCAWAYQTIPGPTREWVSFDKDPGVFFFSVAMWTFAFLLFTGGAGAIIHDWFYTARQFQKRESRPTFENVIRQALDRDKR